MHTRAWPSIRSLFCSLGRSRPPLQVSRWPTRYSVSHVACCNLLKHNTLNLPFLNVKKKLGLRMSKYFCTFLIFKLIMWNVLILVYVFLSADCHINWSSRFPQTCTVIAVVNRDSNQTSKEVNIRDYKTFILFPVQTEKTLNFNCITIILTYNIIYAPN